MCMNKASKVDRSVMIPVANHTAVLAGKDTLGQGQLGFHCLANRAGLGAGEPSAGDFQPAIIPGGLIFELSAKLRKACVGNVSGQLSVLQHAGDVQVFDYNDAILTDQGGGEFVQSVRAGVGYLVVNLVAGAICPAPPV